MSAPPLASKSPVTARTSPRRSWAPVAKTPRSAVPRHSGPAVGSGGVPEHVRTEIGVVGVEVGDHRPVRAAHRHRHRDERPIRAAVPEAVARRSRPVPEDVRAGVPVEVAGERSIARADLVAHPRHHAVRPAVEHRVAGGAGPVRQEVVVAVAVEVPDDRPQIVAEVTGRPGERHGRGRGGGGVRRVGAGVEWQGRRAPAGRRSRRRGARGGGGTGSQPVGDRGAERAGFSRWGRPARG